LTKHLLKIILKIRKGTDQENIGFYSDLLHRFLRHNILINSYLSCIITIAGICVVNKTFFMLIFIGVILYNVFIEYIFSSRFIIN